MRTLNMTEDLTFDEQRISMVNFVNELLGGVVVWIRLLFYNVPWILVQKQRIHSKKYLPCLCEDYDTPFAPFVFLLDLGLGHMRGPLTAQVSFRCQSQTFCRQAMQKFKKIISRVVVDCLVLRKRANLLL